MRRLRTFAAAILITAALFLAAGGCVRSMTLVFESMQQGTRPNAAMIVLAITIVGAVVLFMGARAISKDEDE